jgi:site-specific DNA-cytosine methylase
VQEPDGAQMYQVHQSVLDCQDHGLPQSRRRLYIVGIRTKCCKKAFTWPQPIKIKNTCSQLLGQRRAEIDSNTAATTSQMSRLLQSMEELERRGMDPTNNTFFIDIDASASFRTNMYQMCPCITKTRAATGGFWVSTLRRRMGTRSLAKFQGIPLEDLNTECITERQLRCMIGNAWSVNVATRVMYNLVRCLGFASRAEVADPWI